MRLPCTLAELIREKIHVVSTCEEMAYPWSGYPNLSRDLDKTAQKNKVALVGTGVNPGFLMDYLPVVLTGLCRDVKKIKVSRIQDAAARRIPFQKKIGAGLTLDEFEKEKQADTLRHVGLTESMHLIAHQLGWPLDKTEDIISPVIAEQPITAGYKDILPGRAAGVRQMGRAYVRGNEVITLEFIAAVAQSHPADTISIEGTPNIISTIPGGINGDIATCSIAVNAIDSILKATPGLRLVTDLPAVSCFHSCANR